MRTRKFILLLIFATVMSIFLGTNAFAAVWKTGEGENQQRWWYDYQDGTYAKDGWQWLDGNLDGVAECYYFDEEGWMAAGETTPDGYQVNNQGAWVEDGIVQTKEALSNTNVPETDRRILIAYFSHTESTAAAASLIQGNTGGALFRIQPEIPYSNRYNETVNRARQEQEGEVFPALQSNVENFQEYDIIFIGYPIWLDKTPAVINSFLNSHDWTGKKVIPFCTSGGSGIRGSLSDVRRLCEGAEILEGRDVTGDSAVEIGQWLKQLGLVE